MNYGHLALKSPDQSRLVMESMQSANATLVGKRMLAFFHTELRQEDMKKSSIVDFSDARIASTGVIPGL